MTRKEVLDAAEKCVCKDRNNEYGGPAEKLQQKRRRAKMTIRVCPQCKKKFMVIGAKDKYCGRRCYVAARRAEGWGTSG